MNENNLITGKFINHKKADNEVKEQSNQPKNKTNPIYEKLCKFSKTNLKKEGFLSKLKPEDLL